MREILFRGKLNNSGKWVFGCYYKQLEFYGCACSDHIIITSHEDLQYDQALDYFCVQPETIGQFTGLTDKNGKKVFEGDVLLVYGTDTAVVEWDETSAMFMAVFGYTDADFASLISQYPDVEVIGNIHDNPELLEDSL